LQAQAKISANRYNASMATVGHDKRLNYYQQTGDEVIAELRSHRYGLTNPEAQRRLAQNGGNILPYGVTHSPIQDMADQTKTWGVVVLLIGFGLSLWQQNGKLALTFLSLVAVVTAVGAWRERHIGALLHNLDSLLPRTATVRRNGVDAIIDTQLLVVGDMVVLDPGMRVAADLRLIEAAGLLVDDSNLHSGHAHDYKFTHALPAAVPLNKRHNLAFASTLVIGGSGVGVVVATGAQTEIGRLLSLVQATRPKSSLFQTRLGRQSPRITFALAVFALLLIIAATGYDLPLRLSQTFALTFVAALAPVGVLLSMSTMLATSSNRARRSGVRFQSPSSIDHLGKTDVALIDDFDFVVNATPTTQQVIIGKQTYVVTGEGYNPDGNILGRTHKPLGKKSIQDLSLFFEATVLSNQTRLLPPDADNHDWHITGNSDDGALVALAARAGYQAQEIRSNLHLIRHFPYDHSRKLSSSLYEYDHRLMAFVQGDAVALLPITTQLWEAGHTRKLTAADNTRLTDYIETQIANGNHVVALAYRKFVAKQQADTLGVQDTEQALTLLGLVTIGRPLQSEVSQATQTMLHDAVACSLLTDHSPAVASALIRQLGLGDPEVIDSMRLGQLADSQLLEALSRGGVVFNHLTTEDRLRLVDIAQRSGHNVLITGRSLRDTPAMHHATVSLASASAPLFVRDEADAILLNGNLHDLTRSLNRSRHFITNAGNVLQAAFTDNLALILLTLIGFGLYVSQHIPLALTPLMILAFISLLQPLLASSLDADTLDTRPSFTSLDSLGSRVFLALVAALLTLVNFLFFFVRANHTRSLTSPKLWQNRNILWALGISLLIMINVVYNPLLQPFLGTQPLGVADWLSIFSIALFYGGIRWFVRTERRHNRRAIIELHQDVHGVGAGPKI
jgi:Ca2+-transporting ATPase